MLFRVAVLLGLLTGVAALGAASGFVASAPAEPSPALKYYDPLP